MADDDHPSDRVRADPQALAEALAQHGALRYADVDALEGYLHHPPRATPEAGDPAQPSE